MTAKKTRRRLPDEDVAEAVAQIINNPITRANLSFLKPSASPSADPAAEVFDPTPTGLIKKPPGVDSIPTGYRQATLPQAPEYPAPQASLPLKALWQAEQIGTVFEQGRVRRIERAQDALSLVEEKVYDLLWGPRNLKRDEYRLIHCSLQRLAGEARINIKTVRELIPRLADKGFIRIEHAADPRRNVATLYRVWSYAAILANQREHKRFYIAKTGKGVFYVHPVNASLSPVEPVGVDLQPGGLRDGGYMPEAPGGGSAPEATTPMPPEGFRVIKPRGLSGSLSKGIVRDSPLRHTSPAAYASLIAMIRNLLGAEPDSALLDDMIAECHRRAIETTGQPASDSELLYFAQSKAASLRGMRNIRNHLAVLRKALPGCFSGEAFRVFREAASRRESADTTEMPGGIRDLGAEPLADLEGTLWNQVSERHRSEEGYDMKAIAEDEELDEQGRHVAREMLKRLGRYTKIGI